MQRKGPYLPFDTKRTPLHHKCACIAVETVNEKLHGATHFGGTYVQPRQFHADVWMPRPVQTNEASITTIKIIRLVDRFTALQTTTQEAPTTPEFRHSIEQTSKSKDYLLRPSQSTSFLCWTQVEGINGICTINKIVRTLAVVVCGICRTAIWLYSTLLLTFLAKPYWSLGRPHLQISRSIVIKWEGNFPRLPVFLFFLCLPEEFLEPLW